MKGPPPPDPLTVWPPDPTVTERADRWAWVVVAVLVAVVVWWLR